jgi:excisionase family DNA binding protein
MYTDAPILGHVHNPKEDMVLEDAYYTVEEVSRLFRVTKAAVWKWMREGKLKFVWISSQRRIPVSALTEFIRPGTVEHRDSARTTKGVTKRLAPIPDGTAGGPLGGRLEVAPGGAVRRASACADAVTVRRGGRPAAGAAVRPSVAAAKLFVTPWAVGCDETSCTHTRWHSWGSTRRATGSRAWRRCAPGVGLRRRGHRPPRRTARRRRCGATFSRRARRCDGAFCSS